MIRRSERSARGHPWKYVLYVQRTIEEDELYVYCSLFRVFCVFIYSEVYKNRIDTRRDIHVHLIRRNLKVESRNRVRLMYPETSITLFTDQPPFIFSYNIRGGGLFNIWSYPYTVRPFSSPPPPSALNTQFSASEYIYVIPSGHFDCQSVLPRSTPNPLALQ